MIDKIYEFKVVEPVSYILLLIHTNTDADCCDSEKGKEGGGRSDFSETQKWGVQKQNGNLSHQEKERKSARERALALQGLKDGTMEQVKGAEIWSG